MPDVRDYCTADGARSLAHKIEQYWMARGRAVAVKIIASGGIPEKAGKYLIYVLRSDMVNGHPQ